MKALTFVSLLLTCGLLPFILTQPTYYHSPEDGCMGNALLNMVVLPLQQLRDALLHIRDALVQIRDTPVQLRDAFVQIRDALVQIKDEIQNVTERRSITPHVPSNCHMGANITDNVPVAFTPRDCADLYRAGYEESGVYNVYVYNARFPATVPVYCDMETDGGGWLVFQRRQDGSVDFFKNWAEYAYGFGSIAGEFWLGNDLLHLFTGHEPQQLRVDLRDHEGHSAYAKYGHFYVGPQMSNYTLNVNGYSGNAGDSLSYHDGMKFSTKDRENDASSSRHCALLYNGGWWYNSCHQANLNGLWAPTGQHNGTANSQYTNWKHWRGFYYSILFTEMKMRPLSF